MFDPAPALTLEEQIDQWRSYLRRRQAIYSVDVAELEDHLREQVASLLAAGLDSDEAFLVAVKRMGNLDAVSREFAREHSERLWKQLVIAPSEPAEPGTRTRKDAIAAFWFAVAAAIAVKLPAFFGVPLDDTNESFYFRNASLFVLPVLTFYFAWKRHLDTRTSRWLAAAFVVAVILANVYPFMPEGSTEILSAIHLPIALWLVVGIAYAGSRWSQVAGRMDFIRFTGELLIYYVLIAIGGGVFCGCMAMIFHAIGVDIEPFFQSWLLPCGAAGAVVIASWLVEAKQSVVENMAPVLTRLFTPMFALLLLAFLGALLMPGRGIRVEREVLLVFDLLLIVVLGLLLYSISARDPQAPPNTFDALQILLVVSALAADLVALWVIAARINEYGFSPNRVAVLGVNLILLVNLAWSAVLYVRFTRGGGSFRSLERWQTNYLPVYAVWAAIVVGAFPPLFRFN